VNQAKPNNEKRGGEQVVSHLARLRKKKGLSQTQLAKRCAAESGGDVGKWTGYIQRIEQGRKTLSRNEDHTKVRIMFEQLAPTLEEAFQIIPDLSENEIIEFGFVFDPTNITSKLDEIVLKVGELKLLLRHYGIRPELIQTPLTFCSTSLNLESLLSDLKTTCSQGTDDFVSLIDDFQFKRTPISQLIGAELKESCEAGNKVAVINRINGYLTGMESSMEKLSEIGAEFLDRITAVDGILLVDFSNCWLSILERFEQGKQKRFPPLTILKALGMILSPQDTHAWEIKAKEHKWNYNFLRCNEEEIDNHFRGNKKIVVAVGAEAVDLSGHVLASPGVRLICETAMDYPGATVAVAAQTFKVRDFSAKSYVLKNWGRDQMGLPFSLDIVRPDAYKVIITDHYVHWTGKMPTNLQCCVTKWKNDLEG
jgi:transcriptional regulator with XRE-family HTH domain